MKVTRIVAIAVFAASLGVGTMSDNGASAQSLRNGDTPAEFPPATYKGLQYVDSKGCVFIRAGIDGNVTWVPRVSRSRNVVCGFQPTFAKAQPQPAPSAPAQKPVQITLDAPAAKPAPAKPAPVKRVARVAKPKPVVVAKKPAAAPVAVKKAKVTTQRRAVSACPNASDFSQTYINDGKRLVVRCYPQKQHPAGRDGLETAVIASQSSVTATTRIVPKHVHDRRANTRNVSPPKGYRKVWEDDRLNLYRAEQNLTGREKMALVWTKGVPRKLVRVEKRRVAKVSEPIVHAAKSEDRDVQAIGRVVKKRMKPATARVSTRSTPKAVAAQKTSLSGTRYVQVGTFGLPDNAARTAARLKRSGLPVRIGKYTRNGKIYRMVLAGPFASDAQLSQALGVARKMGFADAVVRK